MPTRVVFLENNLTLAVAEDLEDVRTKIELQARSGRLLNLQCIPTGETVWINPSAVAYLEGIGDEPAA
ncbi:MAG TPA: hypothetical protein VFB51_12080 [Solirubrobacterales bacterium]|nr:hypothetical protein [Solirubrobacterales bacterium]